MLHPPVVTLLTDFGEGSPYVAQMKGVLLSSVPQVRLVDVCHTLPPYSVAAAQVMLRSTAYAFPLGTVHVVVVDPGVGSARRALAVQSRGMFFVGPENGVLYDVAHQEGARVVVLNKPHLWRSCVSPTFHGRDVFAPVACELASGLPLEEVGTPTQHCVQGAIPQVVYEGESCVGCVLQADRFGNLTTNIPWPHGVESLEAWVNGVQVPVVASYHQAPQGVLVALVGSDGYVELAVCEGSAAVFLNSSWGVPVVCKKVSPAW